MNYVRRCLLIGNSRWHWAEKHSEEWQFFHTSPNANNLKSSNVPLSAWAAVGKVPSSIFLDPLKRIDIKHIPILELPPWIGIDRALGAWGAYKRAMVHEMNSQGLLVADAGTILSLTRITANRQFAGGQLVAGLRLQLNALAKGAQNLQDPGPWKLPIETFPVNTIEAMQRGSLQALLGTLLAAQKEAKVPIWLCGGDGPILFELLKQNGSKVNHHPNLVLEGMIDLIDQVKSSQGL